MCHFDDSSLDFRLSLVKVLVNHVTIITSKWEVYNVLLALLYSMVLYEVKKCWSVKSMVPSVWSISHGSVHRIDPTLPGLHACSPRGPTLLDTLLTGNQVAISP